MKLEHSFIVEAPVEDVFAALRDVERIAPCLPGATITGRDPEGDYEGRFTAKLGSETAAYTGSLRIEDVDAGSHTVTLSAAGLSDAGEGGASAKIVSAVGEEDGRARVRVSTDYRISGPLAHSEAMGLIDDVSRRLIAEFAVCLRAELAGAGAGAGGAAPGGAAPGGEPLSRDTGGTPQPPPPVRAGDVPAEAAGGAAPGADPAGLGTLGVPPPSEPGRQPPGATGGAAGPEGTTEAPDRPPAAPEPDPADAAVASAGGAAVGAAGAAAAPPGAGDLAEGPAAPAPPPPGPGAGAPPPTAGPERTHVGGGAGAPAPPPDAGTTPPPPPGGPGGEVPTAGGAGGAPPPPRTGPPPPPGGRERHAPPPEPPTEPAAPAEAATPAAPPPPAPEPARAPRPPAPEPRTGSIPPPGHAPAEGTAAKGRGAPSLLDRLKRLVGRQ